MKGRSALRMTKLPQFVRSRLALRQTAPAEHPDANLLAGFAEQALSAGERARVLEHLARCPECREVLAVSSAPAADSPKPAIEWWKWRWTAAAVERLCSGVLARLRTVSRRESRR